MDPCLNTISIECRGYKATLAEHVHSYHQIVLPNSGKMEIIIDGCPGLIDQDQGAFIVAKSRHEFLCNDGGKFVVLDIPHRHSVELLLPAETLDRLADRKFFQINDNIKHLMRYAVNKNMDNNHYSVLRSWANLIFCEMNDSAPCRIPKKIPLASEGRRLYRLTFLQQNQSRHDCTTSRGKREIPILFSLITSKQHHIRISSQNESSARCFYCEPLKNRWLKLRIYLDMLTKARCPQHAKISWCNTSPLSKIDAARWIARFLTMWRESISDAAEPGSS